MKQSPFKIPLITVSLVSVLVAFGEAGTSPRLQARQGVFVGPSVFYDGELPSVPSEWLNSFYDSVPRMRAAAIAHLGHKQVTCGNLKFIPALPMESVPSCSYSVIGVDFSKSGPVILALVNIVRGGRPYARYLAGFEVRVQDFFGGLFTPEELGDAKIDQLSRVMTKLSRIGTSYEQSHHVDGEVQMSVLGRLKFDPTGSGFPKPVQIGESGCINLGLCLEKATRTRTIVGGKDIHGFADPAELHRALSKTIEILWTGYESLQLNSDEANREKLRSHLAKNAAVVAEEFRQLMVLLRTRNFQIIEIGHFFHGLHQVIHAVDAIMGDELGTESPLLTLLNGAKGEK